MAGEIGGRVPKPSGNVRDGRLDRWLNRRVSRRVSPLLVGTWVRPNHVSIAAMALGVGGAALVAVGAYWTRLLGLAIVQASSVLDCCDGELARLTRRESRAGEWLDVTGDTVAHVTLFAGIGVAAWRDGLQHGLALAAVLAIGSLLSFACVTWAERTSAGRGRKDDRLVRTIDTLVLTLSTRDYHAIVLVCALADRLDWFLWGAAMGAHVFWVILLILLYRARNEGA